MYCSGHANVQNKCTKWWSVSTVVRVCRHVDSRMGTAQQRCSLPVTSQYSCQQGRRMQNHNANL